MKQHWSEKLKKLNACSVAVDWAKTQPSLNAAWQACERGDWMFWLLGKLCKTERQRKKLVLAACDCAATALRYVPKAKKSPKEAIRVARAWANGEAGITIEQIRIAAHAAHAAPHAAAYAAAYAAYAAHAAYAAAYAADAAYAAANAAADAAYAADAADAAYVAAKKETLRKCANIVRKHFPKAPRF